MALVYRGFINDARSAASGKGMPGIRVIPESVPSECTVMEDVETGISEVMNDIISGLTRPLTREEQSPSPSDSGSSSRIIFKGSLKEVNQFFYRRGWTDGLPIIPPTEEEVAEMLTGTDLPSDYMVGKIIPRSGKATVEKIAVNAVMAGALPTFMPVLIAATEALLEPGAVLHWLHSSGASPGAFWAINGPIRNDINVNSSYGVLSPGNIANSAIGRAMGLIIKNIGGVRKGVEEMGCTGNPAKYTLVVGENEEESPWESLHVERGFNKDDSVISQFTVFPDLNSIGGQGTDARGILNAILSRISSRSTGMACIMLTPAYAGTLSREGMTKNDVKQYLSENAMMPYNPRSAQQAGSSTQYKPGDLVPIFSDTDRIMIVVTCGSGPVGGSALHGGINLGSDFVSKKITLPSNWNTLVKKYKHIIPSYYLY
ncbi:MAG: hypothetical protein JXA46_00950 [Dehalococcoidales bacterium]|nr:hypothetical protein [Dehalococcoidales bacterium]